MKNRWGLRLIGLLAVSCVAMSGVSLAVEPGSATDPLITLSYLNETFMGQIMDRVDQKIAQRNSGLGQSRRRHGIFRGDAFQGTGPHRRHRL